MLFNELVEKEGLESIASVTNISTVNLEYLVNENFEKLNRVRALGFLLIFEREYQDIDVSEFRAKIKNYYEENAPLDDKVVMVSMDSMDSEFSFFKTFIILLLLGGGIYLYNTGKLDSLMQQIENKEDFFDDKKALENNVSDSNANKVVVGKPKRESVTIETPALPKSVISEKNDTAKERVEHVALASEKRQEENQPQSVEEVVKEVSEEFLSHEAQLEKNPTPQEEPKVQESIVSTVTINPTRGMLWYGFINLDSKKRREFMKKTSTPFNIANGRWLLVTGHGFFEIVANDKNIALSDRNKHYFYIDSSEIREIGRKEFRELNGNRGW